MATWRHVLLEFVAALILCPAGAAQGGALDTTFGNRGITHLGLGPPISYDLSTAVTVPGGRLAVGGLLGNNDLGVAMLREDGTLDPAFGIDGRVREALRGGQALAALHDGRILLGGSVLVGTQNRPAFAIVRRLPTGERDPSFGANGVAAFDFGSSTSSVSILTVAPDGKIVAVGAPSSAGLPILRVLTNGDLDGSLDGDGQAVLAGSTPATAVAADDAGRIVLTRSLQSAGGIAIAVTRLNPDGSPDATFGSGGTTTITSQQGYVVARAVTTLPDGKLVIAGTMAVADGYDGVLIRLLPAGDMDPSFGTGGRVLVDFASRFDAVEAAAWMPDGRMVLAGYRLGASYDIVVARRLPDGGPDASFGTNGRVYIDRDGGTDFARSAALYADGSVGLAVVTSEGGADADAAVRVDASGTMHLDFGDDGFATAQFIQPNAVARAVIAGPGGTLYVAGRASLGGPTASDFFVARLRADGTLDPSFGNAGVSMIHFGSPDEARALALLPDGRVLVAGTTGAGGASPFCATRLLDDGTVDSTFGVAGRVQVTVPGALGTNGAFGVAIQPDGRAVLAGSAWYLFAGGGWQMALLRLNQDGALDTSFGDGGAALAGLTLHPDRAHAIATLPDGRIVAAGMLTPTSTTAAQSGAVRFHADGAVDSSFGEAGYFFGSGMTAALALQPDGRPVLAGWVYATGSSSRNVGVMRLTPEGELDQTFASAGVSNTGTASDDEANAVAMLPDGRILAAGYTGNSLSTRDWTAHLLLPAGALDSSFDLDGRRPLDFAGGEDAAHGTVAHAGGVVVVGSASIFQGIEAAVARFLVEPLTTTAPPAETPAFNLETLPNPIRYRATIRFSLDGAGLARVAVHDLLGREVAVVRDGPAAAGRHEMTFNTAGLDAGVYVVRLVTNEQVLTRRVTIVR